MDARKLNWTQLEYDLFDFLCIHAGEKLSQREIAKLLDVSPTSIGKCVKTLKDMNLVKIEITKSINFISFNRDEELAIKLKRVQNIKQIYLSELMNYLETEFTSSTISLFGSFSRGEDTVSSDIDIAVIGRKDKLLHLEKYEKMLNRKININFYSSFKDIHVHLRNNILGGILFYGVIEL